MELKFVNPDAELLHEALGISEERRVEICELLDDMVEHLPRTEVAPIKTLVQKVASFCETNEEFAFAFACHAMWLSKRQFVGPQK
jgi:hypothetical protein